jgi:hypothetical protein
MGDGLTSGGYVKVKSTPYAYDQGAEAERDDSKGASLLWFSHPQIRGIAGNSGIGCGVLHLFMVSRGNRSHKRECDQLVAAKCGGFTRLQDRQQASFYLLAYCMLHVNQYVKMPLFGNVQLDSGHLPTCSLMCMSAFQGPS